MVIVLGIGLYTSRILLQVLGVEDFGIYNVVAGFVAMFAFLNTSMNNAIQRFYNYELGKNGEDGMRRVYNCSLIAQVLIALVIIILTETFGLWYIYEKLVLPPERFDAALWVFQLSVISLLFLVIQIPYSSAIMAHECMDYYAVVSVIDAALKLALIFLIPLIQSDNLVIYGIIILFISLVDFFLYYIYAKQRFPEIKIEKKFEKSLFNEILKFSGWNLFGSFSGVMKEQGLNLLLNLFFGPVVNAARGIAYQVSGGVQSFVMNITTAARPQMTQAYAQGNIERTLRIMFSMSKMSYISVFIFALPVMLEVDYILHLWLGNGVPDHTGAFVVLVVFSSLINVFNPPTSFVVHATGKMKSYQTITSLFSLLLLPVSYLFLYIGCAPEIVFVLVIIFTALGQLISLLILKKLITISLRLYFGKVIMPSLMTTILSTAVPFVAYYYMDRSFLRFSVVTILSLLSVSLFSYLIEFDKDERSIVKDFIRRIKIKING